MSDQSELQTLQYLRDSKKMADRKLQEAETVFAKAEADLNVWRKISASLALAIEVMS